MMVEDRQPTRKMEHPLISDMAVEAFPGFFQPIPFHSEVTE